MWRRSGLTFWQLRQARNSGGVEEAETLLKDSKPIIGVADAGSLKLVQVKMVELGCKRLAGVAFFRVLVVRMAVGKA